MSDVKRVSPNEAETLVREGYVYVDVRSEPEFAEGHPAGAYNVPLMHVGAGGMQPNPRFSEVMQACFPRDAKIVVGCKAGGRSLKAAGVLVGLGYTSVVDQRAGWDGVRDAFGRVSEPGWGPLGLAREDGAPAGRNYTDLVAKAT
jgi:rhodanese-related sulfurtransferase